MPKHIAKWNPARDAWEDTRGGTSLFCGHSDVYSGTFPHSGMTVNGVAYEQRTWEHRTGDTGYSSSPNDDDEVIRLLPSPVAQPSGNAPEVHLRKKPGRTVVTDLAIIAENGLIQSGGKLPPTPRVERLLPTPAARLGDPNSRGSSHPDRRKELNSKRSPQLDELTEHVVTTEWGPYEPSVRKWERILGRPAPAPTGPTGRNGKHRLSPAFVEWMMGIPEGWVTDVPISRNDQLKALGNGVVPQQCAAALRDMLANTEAGQVAA